MGERVEGHLDLRLTLVGRFQPGLLAGMADPFQK